MKSFVHSRFPFFPFSQRQRRPHQPTQRPNDDTRITNGNNKKRHHFLGQHTHQDHPPLNQTTTHNRQNWQNRKFQSQIPESQIPKVIHISSRELCDSEITLLEKGLKFTPTPKQNKRELKNDLEEFGRKLRLLEHFSSHEQQPDSSLEKSKSNFAPPLPNDRHLMPRKYFKPS